MTRIAIYDMDKTITRRPTWTSFAIHSAARMAPWRLALLPLVGLAAAGYLTGAVDRARLKEIVQRLMIGRAISPAALAPAIAQFADRTFNHGCRGGALTQIAADRAAGYRLVVATASFDYYARAIADAIGFDDVIATRSLHDGDGRLRARIDGENCYGEAKLRRIEAWLAGEGVARDAATIRFYSDHVSDGVVLDWADEAFAINPHAPLRALATTHGWTIIDWTD